MTLRENTCEIPAECSQEKRRAVKFVTLLSSLYRWSGSFLTISRRIASIKFASKSIARRWFIIRARFNFTRPRGYARRIIYRFGLLTWQPSSADLSLTACTTDVRTPCNNTTRRSGFPISRNYPRPVMSSWLSPRSVFFLLCPASTPISHDIMVSRPSPGDTTPKKQRNGTRGSY